MCPIDNKWYSQNKIQGIEEQMQVGVGERNGYFVDFGQVVNLSESLWINLK